MVSGNRGFVERKERSPQWGHAIFVSTSQVHFRCDFCCNYPLPPASMSDDPTEALPPRGRSLRILVVEDHGDTLRVLARLLDHFGHEISLANGAQSALEMIESKEFDVVLGDIGLPDGSGYEVIAQAKRKQPVKGVALTGFDKEEDIRRSKEAGFDFHLAKPVDFHELRTILAQVGSGLLTSPPLNLC